MCKLEGEKGVLSVLKRGTGRVSGLVMVKLGEMNVLCELERGDSCICQNCTVVAMIHAKLKPRTGRD